MVAGLAFLGVIILGFWPQSGSKDRRDRAARPPSQATGIDTVDKATSRSLVDRSQALRRIRVRNSDGTFSVVEETPELLAEWQKREEDARNRFESSQDEFHDAFLSKLQNEGPGSAYQYLDSFLRNPTHAFEDKGKVFRAVELAIQILEGGADGDPAVAPFNALTPALRLKIRSILTGAENHPTLKLWIIGQIGHLDSHITFSVGTGTFVDGLWTYDATTPVAATPMLKSPGRGTLELAGERSNLLLEEFAAILLNFFNDRAGWGTMRKSALLALAGQHQHLDKIDILGVATQDPADDVRRAAIDLMEAQISRVNSDTVFAVLEAQGDSATKAYALERLGSAAFDDPRMHGLLEAIFSRSFSSIDPWKDSLLRDAALGIAVERYDQRRDSTTFALLVDHLAEWAAEDWRASSPVVTIAEAAARGGLKEFLPYLQSVLHAMTSPSHRTRVRDAIRTLSKGS